MYRMQVWTGEDVDTTTLDGAITEAYRRVAIAEDLRARAQQAQQQGFGSWRADRLTEQAAALETSAREVMHRAGVNYQLPQVPKYGFAHTQLYWESRSPSFDYHSTLLADQALWEYRGRDMTALQPPAEVRQQARAQWARELDKAVAFAGAETVGTLQAGQTASLMRLMAQQAADVQVDAVISDARAHVRSGAVGQAAAAPAAAPAPAPEAARSQRQRRGQARTSAARGNGMRFGMSGLAAEFAGAASAYRATNRPTGPSRADSASGLHSDPVGFVNDGAGTGGTGGKSAPKTDRAPTTLEMLAMAGPAAEALNRQAASIAESSPGVAQNLRDQAITVQTWAAHAQTGLVADATKAAVDRRTGGMGQHAGRYQTATNYVMGMAKVQHQEQVAQAAGIDMSQPDGQGRLDAYVSGLNGRATEILGQFGGFVATPEVSLALEDLGHEMAASALATAETRLGEAGYFEPGNQAQAANNFRGAVGSSMESQSARIEQGIANGVAAATQRAQDKAGPSVTVEQMAPQASSTVRQKDGLGAHTVREASSATTPTTGGAAKEAPSSSKATTVKEASSGAKATAAPASAGRTSESGGQSVRRGSSNGRSAAATAASAVAGVPPVKDLNTAARPSAGPTGPGNGHPKVSAPTVSAERVSSERTVGAGVS